MKPFDVNTTASSTSPLFGCVLVGGKSRRMGRPKHLLPHPHWPGKTWVERTVEVLREFTQQVVLAGAATLPERLAGEVQLDDAPDAQGPMAGVLAAMRWAPRANWIVVACDHPGFDVPAVEWLLNQRRPEAWFVLPSMGTPPRVQPLLAYYDCRGLPTLEQMAASHDFRLYRLESHANSQIAPIPPRLIPAWRDIDSPDDLVRPLSVP
jgi:molybdopterin-guanine dinucleotide biosynthesis protein A